MHGGIRARTTGILRLQLNCIFQISAVCSFYSRSPATLTFRDWVYYRLIIVTIAFWQLDYLGSMHLWREKSKYKLSEGECYNSRTNRLIKIVVLPENSSNEFRTTGKNKKCRVARIDWIRRIFNFEANVQIGVFIFLFNFLLAFSGLVLFL